MSKYKFQKYDQIPAWVYWSPGQSTATRDGELLWSGDSPPPKVGEIIDVAFNKIGRCRVTGYASEFHWLGVMAVPLNPPDWWVIQNGIPGDANAALVYGCEIRSKA